MTALDIEIAVAHYLDWRRNIIVPNVYWGWGLRYEADMVVITAAGYAVEVEIKVTPGDIKADIKKNYHHDSNRFRRLWFAVPERLANDPNIPLRAGILAVTDHVDAFTRAYAVKTIRGGQLNKSAIKMEDHHVRKLLELGVMRVWSLKQLRATNKTQPPA